MKKNRLTTGQYTLGVVILTLINFFIYLKFISVIKWNFIAVTSFIVSLTSFVIVGWLETAFDKKRRKITNMVMCTIYPFLIYDASMFCFAAPEITKVGVISILITGGLCACIAWVKMKRTKRKKRFLRNWKHYASIFACVVFVIISGYGRFVKEGGFKIYAVRTESESDVMADENNLDSNIEIISRVDPQNGWNTYKHDKEALSEILSAIIRVECRYLGMAEEYPKLELAKIKGDSILGLYDHEKDTIKISHQYVINAESGYDVLRTVCHEMRHRYQHRLVSMYESLKEDEETKKYAELLLLQGIPAFQKEWNNYISGDENVELYAEQAIEKDAYSYASISKEEYKERIEEYLKKGE